MTLASRLAAEDCVPKKRPRQGRGMILLTIDCQTVAVRPPPIPCQTSRRKTRASAVDRLNPGRVQANNARPRNGNLSNVVIASTIGL